VFMVYGDTGYIQREREIVYNSVYGISW
jgi:hypothetical protein